MKRGALSGVVLAGGQSRRMGQDKASMAWGSTTLLEHVLQTLRPVVGELIVSAKDEAPFGHLSVAVVKDRVVDGHALGGVYSSLLSISYDRCFVCACDTPFLNRSLVEYLIQQSTEVDAVVPTSKRGIEPLCAVYSKSFLPILKECVDQKEWSLKKAIDRGNSRILSIQEVRRFDPEELSFLNVNTPKEYFQAASRQEDLRCSA